MITIQTNDHHLTFHFKAQDGSADTIEGDVENVRCNWTVPYKDGEIRYKTLLAKSSGETFDAVVSIEATAGKIYFDTVMVDRGGRHLRIPVENYEQKD